MATKDRSRDKLIDRVLGDSSLYPDELKSWVTKFLPGNPFLKLEDYQLPDTESVNYVGQGSNPAFQGAWANVGSSNESAGFYKDAFGRVHLSGLVSGGTVGSTIFSLSAAYRPSATQEFAVATGTGYGRIDVASNGDVVLAAGGTTGVSLSGISFRS